MNLTDSVFQLFLTLGAEWVMWLLALLSVASFAIIFERLFFYSRNRVADYELLLPMLTAGKFDDARAAIEGKTGLEAEVLAAALQASDKGANTVDEVISASLIQHRQPYERYLSFLGTLGNNAPFIGLFGTVIGIIDAFASLGVGTEGMRAGASAVMSGISEALVATAVGIFVALPAVVSFNAYNRWLKTITARADALGHAVVAHLKREAE